jgi:hypothetical protein
LFPHPNDALTILSNGREIMALFNPEFLKRRNELTHLSCSCPSRDPCLELLTPFFSSSNLLHQFNPLSLMM